MKTLWCVGAGEEAVLGIQRAKEMGVRVIASDGNPDAPGFRYADVAVTVDTYKAQATANEASRLAQLDRIHGAIAMCVDVPMTVAAVQHALGVPEVPASPDVAEFGGNKMLQYQKLRMADIPVPETYAVATAERLAAWRRNRDNVQGRIYPDGPWRQWVVKPVDGRGARGVIRLLDGVETGWAFEKAKDESRWGGVIVQEWIEGPQVSTEAVLFKDNCSVSVAVLDRNYEYLERYQPYVIENGATGPSVLSATQVDALERLTVAAGRALGVRQGTIKGDLVWGPYGPVLIELALRLSGGYMSTEAIPMATGVDLVEAAIRLALGESIDRRDLLPKMAPRAVAIRYRFPEGPVQNHTQRGAHLTVTAPTRAEVVRLASAFTEQTHA